MSKVLNEKEFTKLLARHLFQLVKNSPTDTLSELELGQHAEEAFEMAAKEAVQLGGFKIRGLGKFYTKTLPGRMYHTPQGAYFVEERTKVYAKASQTLLK